MQEDQRLALMHKARAGVDWLIARALIALMAVAVINVLWQVFTRWVLADPSSYTEELARYLLIWVGLLGAAYAVGKKLHLAIDLLPSMLTGRPKHLLDIVIEGLVLAFAFFVMVVGGYRLMELTLRMEQTSAALQVPLGYVYSVIPLSGVLITFYAATFIVERVAALRGAAVEVTESDRTTTKMID
jgi:TRAP-type C4-dicarboxylate transport system permease small subunit